MSEENVPNDYRTEILDRLDKQKEGFRLLERIFTNYSSIVDDLARSRQGTSRHRASTSEDTNSELHAVKEEMGLLYKQKNKNDQDLIEANRRLVECETKLSKVSDEKDVLATDKNKLCARIAELEHALKQSTDREVAIRDEWLALTAMNKVQTQKISDLEQEQLQLVNKIRELNEQKASMMNAEIETQAQIQQRRIQENIAKAISDTTRDDQANFALAHSNAPLGDVFLGDCIPTMPHSKFESNDGEILDVLWLTSDMFATGGSDRKVKVWQMDVNRKQSKKCTLTGCNQAITRLDFLKEKNYILASSNDFTARLWDIESQRLISTFSGHTDKVFTARFYQNNQVITGSSDRSIKIWDMRGPRCVKTYFPGSSVHDVIGQFPNGGAAFISGHFDKKIRIWDGRDQEPSRIIEIGNRITSLFMALDGYHLLCSSRDDTLSIMDIRSKGIVHNYSADMYRTSSDYTRCCISPAMEYVAAGSNDGSIFIWNFKSTKLEKVLSKGGHEHPILSVNWNPSGRGLISADKQKTAVLWM